MCPSDLLDDVQAVQRHMTTSTPPVLYVSKAPKTGSTFLSHSLLNIIKSVHKYSIHKFGEIERQGASDISLSQNIDRLRLYGLCKKHGAVMGQGHTMATPSNLKVLKDFGAKVIFTRRNILDTLVSYTDNTLKKFTPVNIPHAIFEGGEWGYTRDDDEGHKQMWRDLHTGETLLFSSHSSRFQIEGIDKTYAENLQSHIVNFSHWYGRVYAYWYKALYEDPENIRCIQYEDMITDKVGVFGDIVEWLGIDIHRDEIGPLIDEIEQNKTKSNFNVGRTGRGQENINGEQIDYIRKALNDFLPIQEVDKLIEY